MSEIHCISLGFENNYSYKRNICPFLDKPLLSRETGKFWPWGFSLATKGKQPVSLLHSNGGQTLFCLLISPLFLRGSGFWGVPKKRTFSTVLKGNLPLTNFLNHCMYWLWPSLAAMGILSFYTIHLTFYTVHLECPASFILDSQFYLY